jgi:hypothetical protein
MIKITRIVLVIYIIAIALCCIYVPWEANFKDIHVARGYAPIWAPPKGASNEPTFYSFTSIDVSRTAIEFIGITVIAVSAWIILKRK